MLSLTQGRVLLQWLDLPTIGILLITSLIFSAEAAYAQADQIKTPNDSNLIEPDEPALGEKENISKEERPPRGYLQIGAGYNSIESFIFNARVGHDGLFIDGLSLSLSSLISAARLEFDLSLSGSRELHEPLFWRLDLNDRRFVLNDHLGLRQTGGKVGVGRWFGQSLSLSLGYRIKQESFESPLFFKTNHDNFGPSQWVSALWMEGELNWSRAIENTTLRGGLVLRASAERAATALGSSASFSRVEASGDYGIGLGWGTHLQLSAQVGQLSASDPSKIPLMERFHLGGLFSWRGLARELPELGPTRVLGEGEVSMGGLGVAHAAGDLYLPLWKRVGLYGSAGLQAGGLQEEGDAPADGFVAGQAGVHWFSPIGPISASIMQPFIGTTRDEPYVFISIGGAL